MSAAADVLAAQQAAAGVLHGYARAIDGGAWEDLRAVFTPDCVVDFGELGGVRHGVEAAIAFIRRALERFVAVQHFVTNIAVGDDGRSSSCYFLAHHVRRSGELYLVGGTYEDRFAQTDEGLRIAERTLRVAWQR